MNALPLSRPVRFRAVPALLLVLCTFASALPAADSNEARLREQLRATAIQLRTSETERATLQAAKAADDEKIKALTEQVAAQQKRIAADKEAADKAAAEAKAQLAERDAQLKEVRDVAIKSDSALKKLTAEAKAIEEKRAAAAAKIVVLERRVADQALRNRKMFTLGMEVLSRYEKFGLGDALTAREPFIGLTRVKFENLIQDFSDKLADARVKP